MFNRRRSKPREAKDKPPKPEPDWKKAGFKSSLEFKAANDFKARGIEYLYEPLSLQYAVNVRRKYTPDFYLKGMDYYVEFKGYFPPEDRMKMVYFKEGNPDVEIRFVFQDASKKIRKGSKTSYGDWCNEHGFKWAERTVPEEWLNDTIENNARKRKPQPK